MAKNELYSQVDVCIPGHQYPVIMCPDGLDNSKFVRSFVSANQVLIVSNQTVAALYLERLKSAFAGLQCDVVLLPDGEEFKNQQGLTQIYDSLIKNKHHRDTTLFALGGGVIGDVTGFAASTYQRGVRLIQIPTTLLAQVDASVGGKTAINHPLGKNLIGSFYQPQAVLIDIHTLDSLPKREFQAGLAEIIKYGLLEGGSFLMQLQNALKKGITAHSPELPQLILDCCAIKAQFVAGDEKEQGRRALLNLGHTFAHALEAHTHYKKWLHGEAVAIGLYCAGLLSDRLGLGDGTLAVQIEGMLQQAGLSHKIPRTIQLDALKDLMRLDKKIKNNSVRFVVIKKPGDCYLDDGVTEDCLHNTLISAVEGEEDERGKE